MQTVPGLIVAITLLVSATASAQQPPATPDSMATMPGMTNAPPDMVAQMKQCADMRKSMPAGAPMSPQMQALMQRCDKMDRDMNQTQAPPDTLGR